MANSNKKNSFSDAFSETFNKNTDKAKASAGKAAANILTSWRGWCWIIAIIVAVIFFITGSPWVGIGILALALLITCAPFIFESFI